MKLKTAPRYWRPLVLCPSDQLHYSDELIAYTMQQYGKTEDEARAMLDAEARGTEVWVNDLYQVEVTRFSLVRNDGKDTLPIVQLNIRRRDGSCDLRDWRHFQEIKNQLVGSDREGVEIYPAEDRKVDTSNKWHIWCVDDPAFRFPFGWKKRDVVYDTGKCAGLKQRSF